jgi:hypothetical protein
MLETVITFVIGFVVGVLVWKIVTDDRNNRNWTE